MTWLGIFLAIILFTPVVLTASVQVFLHRKINRRAAGLFGSGCVFLFIFVWQAHVKYCEPIYTAPTEENADGWVEFPCEAIVPVDDFLITFVEPAIIILLVLQTMLFAFRKTNS